MSDLASCASICLGAAVPSACCPTPIVLAEALGRFERDAVRGICNTGRYRMSYYTWGQGPPLLFIHGLWDSSRSFLMPVSRLAAHFRCITYEQPAGGADGARLARYSHADLVADVWALLDHLGISQSYVHASSFGATIALEALRQQPRRLPRAVLQGALAYRPLRRAELLIAHLGRLLPGTAARLPLRRLLLRLVNPGVFDDRPVEVFDYFVDCNGRSRIAAVAWQALLLHRLDLRPLLSEVRQPVLLLSGDRDTVVGSALEEELLRGLPNSGRVVLEGSGHVPSYTHPEALAEVVRQFLTPS
jgi:pimeloyl-ACP methyl ester carboxylesterase